MQIFRMSVVFLALLCIHTSFSSPILASTLIQGGLVEDWVERKVDPRIQSEFGYTPLHWASEEGHIDAVKGFMREGENPNLRDKYGRTPLHYGAKSGIFEVVQILLSRGSYPNAKDEDFRTPLHYGVLSGNLEVVRFLIEKGSDVNAVTKAGYTPLHEGAFNGYAGIVRHLVEKGAKASIRTKKGNTLVHAGALWFEGYGRIPPRKEEGKLEVIKYLIRKKVDPFLKNKEGKTARDLAEEFKLWNIRDFLWDMKRSG